ncbi:uncharacterized protein LOC143028541 [Oratosquilla oratoria]|uniref:uncharacterized protein LOC143028541 n=1 Tax=Oratosquilla oratoria TaxID=337810 RepID=UPI003F778271
MTSPKAMPRRTLSSSSSSPSSSPVTSPGLATSSRLPAPQGPFSSSTTTTTTTTSSQARTLTTTSHTHAITSCQDSSSRVTSKTSSGSRVTSETSSGSRVTSETSGGSRVTSKTSNRSRHSRNSSVSSSGYASALGVRGGGGGGGPAAEPLGQVSRATKEEEGTPQWRTRVTKPPQLQLQMLVSPTVNIASTNAPTVDVGPLASQQQQQKGEEEEESRSQRTCPATEARRSSPTGDNKDGHKDLLSSLGLNHFQKSVYRASVIHYDEDCEDVSFGSSSALDYQEVQSSQSQLLSGSQISSPTEETPHTRQGLCCSKDYSFYPSTNKVCSVEPSEFSIGPDTNKRTSRQPASATSTSRLSSSKANSRLKYLEFAACPTRKESLDDEAPVLKGRAGNLAGVISKGFMAQGRSVPHVDRTPEEGQKVLHKEGNVMATQGMGRPSSESLEVLGSNGEARSSQSSWSASSMVPWQGSLEGLVEMEGEEEEGEEREGLKSEHKRFRERLERARKPAKYLESVIELPQDSMLDRVFRCFKDLQLTQDTSDITSSEIVNVDDEFFDALPVKKLAVEYWTRHPGVDNWKDDLFFKDLSLEEEQFQRSEVGSVCSAADQHKIDQLLSPMSSMSEVGDHRPFSEGLPPDASSAEVKRDVSASQTSSSSFLETTRLIDPGDYLGSSSLSLDQERYRSLYEENVVVTPPVEFRAEASRHKPETDTPPQKEAWSPLSPFRLITEDEYLRSLNDELKRHFESHSGRVPPKKDFGGHQTSITSKPCPMPSSLAPTAMMQHVDSPECSISNLENPRRTSYFRELIASHSNEPSGGSVTTGSLDSSAGEVPGASGRRTCGSSNKKNKVSSNEETSRSGDESPLASPDSKSSASRSGKTFASPDESTSRTPEAKILASAGMSKKSQKEKAFVLQDGASPVPRDQKSIFTPRKKTLEWKPPESEVRKSSGSLDKITSPSSDEKTIYSPDSATPVLRDITTPDGTTPVSPHETTSLRPDQCPVRRRHLSKESTSSTSSLTRAKRNTNAENTIVLKVAAPPRSAAGRDALSTQISSVEEISQSVATPSHVKCMDRSSRSGDPRSQTPSSSRDHTPDRLQGDLVPSGGEEPSPGSTPGCPEGHTRDATSEDLENKKEPMPLGGDALSSASERKRRSSLDEDKEKTPRTTLETPHPPTIPASKPSRPDTLPLKSRTSDFLPQPPDHDPPLPPQLLPAPQAKVRFRRSSFLEEAHFLSDTTEEDLDSPRYGEKEKRSYEQEFFYSPATMLVATLGGTEGEVGKGSPVVDVPPGDPTQKTTLTKETPTSKDGHLSVASPQSAPLSLKTENFFSENTMMVAKLGSSVAEDQTLVEFDEEYCVSEVDEVSATITLSNEISVTVVKEPPKVKVDRSLGSPARVVLKTESKSTLRLEKCSSESDENSDSVPPPVNFNTHPLASDASEKDEEIKEEEGISHDSASCDFSDESTTVSEDSEETPQVRVIRMHSKVRNDDLKSSTEISSHPSTSGTKVSSLTEVKNSRFLSHKMYPDSDSDEEDETEGESGQLPKKSEEVLKPKGPKSSEEREIDREKTETTDTDLVMDKKVSCRHAPPPPPPDSNARATADTKPGSTPGGTTLRQKRHPAPQPPTGGRLPPVEEPHPLAGSPWEASSPPVVDSKVSESSFSQPITTFALAGPAAGDPSQGTMALAEAPVDAPATTEESGRDSPSHPSKASPGAEDMGREGLRGAAPLIVHTCYDSDASVQTTKKGDEGRGGSVDGVSGIYPVGGTKKRPAPPVPVPVPVPVQNKSPPSSSSSPRSSCASQGPPPSIPPSPEEELWSGSSWGIVPPEIADLDGEDFVKLLPTLVASPTKHKSRLEEEEEEEKDNAFEAMVSKMYAGADDDDDDDDQESTESAEVVAKSPEETPTPAEHIADDGDVLEVFYESQESTENGEPKLAKPEERGNNGDAVHVDCKMSRNAMLRMNTRVGLNESSGSRNGKCGHDGDTRSLLRANNPVVANVSPYRDEGDSRRLQRQFFRDDGHDEEPEEKGRGRGGVARRGGLEEKEEGRGGNTQYALEKNEDPRALPAPGSHGNKNGEVRIGVAKLLPSQEKHVQPRSNGYLITRVTKENLEEKRQQKRSEDQERRETVLDAPQLCRKDPPGNNQVFKLEIKGVTGDKTRFYEEKHDDGDDDDEESKTKGVHLLGTFNFTQKSSALNDHRAGAPPPDIFRSSLLTNISPDPSLTDSYVSLDAGGCVVEHFNFIGALEKPRDLSLIRQDDNNDYTSLTESVYSEDGKHVIGVFDFTNQKKIPSHTAQQNNPKQQNNNINARNLKENEHNLQFTKSHDFPRVQEGHSPGNATQSPSGGPRQEHWTDDSKSGRGSSKKTDPLGDSARPSSLSRRIKKYIAKDTSDGEGDDDTSSSRMSSLRSSLSSPSVRSSPVTHLVGRSIDTATSETFVASHQLVLNSFDVRRVSDSDFEGDLDEDLPGGRSFVTAEGEGGASSDRPGDAGALAKEDTLEEKLSEGRRDLEEAKGGGDDDAGACGQQQQGIRKGHDDQDERGCASSSSGQGERGTEACILPASRSVHGVVGSTGRCGWPAGEGVGLEVGRRGEVRQGGRGGHVSHQVEAADLSRLTCVDFEEADRSTMLVTDSALQHRDLNHNNKKNAANSILGTSASKYLVGPHEEDVQVLAGGFQENPIYDAGYSSERSPEDEEGPLLCSDHNSSASESSSASSSFRIPTTDEDVEQSHLQKALREGNLTLHQLQHICPFINEGCMFEVTVVKNSRGLGLAVTGGVESTGPWAGLIRIKRLYPQTPAWLCGQLQSGDIILAANGVSFIGLSSHEALEFLRTTGGEVALQACRPPANALEMEGVVKSPDDRLQVVSTSLTRPFCVSPSSHVLLSPSSLTSYGDFEVELSKVAGSLGFTLRKQDNSILGHTIRSLVKEPAISDGRIRAGDKIISVNGTDMCSMSHEEAIAFLRTCPQTVVLRLYRDASQTPVSPVSPSEPELPLLKPKALRKEARDMLSDLAFRKQSPSNSPNMMECTGSPGTLRRRRLQKTPSPDIKSVVADRWDSLVRKTEDDSSSSLPEKKHLDSIKENGENQYSSLPVPDHSPDSCHSTPSTPNTVIPQSNISNSPSLSPSNSDSIKPRRPDYLDLKSVPVSCPRKTQFTPPHEIDRSFPSSAQSLESTSIDAVDSVPQLTSAQSDTPAFSHLHQGYQSVNLGALHTHEDTRLSTVSSDYSSNSRDGAEGKKSGLLKWKGIVFTPEEEDDPSLDIDEGKEMDLSVSKSLKPKMVTLKLNRGWNSRLGFSLQPQGDVTVVTAIYANSVADKDGRLMIGDRVMKVNGQDVHTWKTEEVIDLLRKTKGDISLTVLQQHL